MGRGSSRINLADAGGDRSRLGRMALGARPGNRARVFQAAARGVFAMRAWPSRRWLVALAATVAAALAMGTPTGVVPTPLYSRMTPVTWWDRPILALSALLVGLLAASYVRVGPQPQSTEGAGRTLGGGVLSTFAIGCPICNKIVVALIGISGSLTYWAPLQPFLGLSSVALLTAALALRLRGDVACSTTTSDRVRPA